MKNKYIEISQVVTSSGVKFGTSGMRGLVSDITDKVTWCYTKAFIQFLEQKHNLSKSSNIAVAHDLRDSSPRITVAVIDAIYAAGYNPIFCGEISSPAIMSYGLAHGIPSIMVTGSHIPEDRNGIKFNTQFGEILKSDEADILNQTVDFDETLFENDILVSSNILPVVNHDGLESFISRYMNFFPKDSLAGIKIGLYEHSSVASILLKRILVALGADVLPLGYSQKFVSVDTEAIRVEDIALAKQWMSRYSLDSIVSTDGDGDRPLISDENGNWLKGDIVGIFTTKFLGIKSIVTPISSNTALEKSNLFEDSVRTQIGSPYVIDAMNKLISENKTSVAGYEANGGVLLATDININGKVLTQLATRDATIAILCVLMMSKQDNCNISSLVDNLPARFTESSKINDFATSKSQQIISDLIAGTSDALVEIIAKYYHGDVSMVDINTLDGVRMTFSNDDIVHFRASGNAPEFRVYTESSTVELAAGLNDFCKGVVSGL